MHVNYILTSRTLTVNFDNQTHTLDKGTTEFDQVVSCIKNKTYDEIPNIISAALRLKKYSGGAVTIENGAVFMDGEELPSQLSNTILDFEKEGLPYEPLVQFWSKLKKNPSYRARNQLFSFLEHNGHPITEDGCFIAYKGVTVDFKDCHTGKFDNSVGTVVVMPRENVDDDPTHTCSAGLHVASYNYAHSNYGHGASGVTVEVKIDPADVVAVPVDYSGEKMRTCRYEVIGVSKGEIKSLYQPTNPCCPSAKCDEECEDEDEETEFCQNCGDEIYDATLPCDWCERSCCYEGDCYDRGEKDHGHNNDEPCSECELCPDCGECHLDEDGL